MAQWPKRSAQIPITPLPISVTIIANTTSCCIATIMSTAKWTVGFSFCSMATSASPVVWRRPQIATCCRRTSVRTAKSLWWSRTLTIGYPDNLQWLWEPSYIPDDFGKSLLINHILSVGSSFCDNAAIRVLFPRWSGISLRRRTSTLRGGLWQAVCFRPQFLLMEEPELCNLSEGVVPRFYHWAARISILGGRAHILTHYHLNVAGNLRFLDVTCQYSIQTYPIRVCLSKYLAYTSVTNCQV